MLPVALDQLYTLSAADIKPDTGIISFRVALLCLLHPIQSASIRLAAAICTWSLWPLNLNPMSVRPQHCKLSVGYSIAPMLRPLPRSSPSHFLCLARAGTQHHAFQVLRAPSSAYVATRFLCGWCVTPMGPFSATCNTTVPDSVLDCCRPASTPASGLAQWHTLPCRRTAAYSRLPRQASLPQPTR